MSAAEDVSIAASIPDSGLADAYYKTVYVRELSAYVLAAAGGPARGRRVQFLCRLEHVDDYVDTAVAVDPELKDCKLPLSTHLVSPLAGPKTGLWQIFGYLHMTPPTVEVFIAVHMGHVDYSLYVTTLELRRRLLEKTGLA
jgi:hypothetical protein